MRKTIISLAILLIIVIVSTFSLSKYEKDKKEMMLERGNEIYKENCLRCHALGNLEKTGKRWAPDMYDPTLPVRYINKERLESFILKSMPDDNPGQLTKEQAKILADYLWEINQH